ncbi:Uncharacterised protein [Mycobacteroides abscessus subsp. abscessus]|nr:Uncharacterised protein [Mycobacteroides abscessus subsp. abscessus]
MPWSDSRLGFREESPFFGVDVTENRSRWELHSPNIRQRLGQDEISGQRGK